MDKLRRGTSTTQPRHNSVGWYIGFVQAKDIKMFSLLTTNETIKLINAFVNVMNYNIKATCSEPSGLAKPSYCRSIPTNKEVICCSERGGDRYECSSSKLNL